MTNPYVNANAAGIQDLGDGGPDGTRVGRDANALVGLWGATPAARGTTSGETTGHSAVGGANVNANDTFTGNVGTTAYTINDIVKYLKNLGAMPL